MIEIDIMRDEYLESIQYIDRIAFEREKARSTKNLIALRITDFEGCHVLLKDGSVIGYSFTKTLGKTGYIGPIAILSQNQGSGFGKILIQTSINYLKKKCDIIGLEVLPEKGRNIGFYYSLGFISVYPTLIMKVKRPKFISRKYEVVELTSMDHKLQADFVKKIDEWSTLYLDGEKYGRDLKAAIKLNGRIFVVTNGQSILGILSYCNTLMPHAWGVVNTDDYNAVYNDLVSCCLNSFEMNEITVAVNSRYNLAVNMLNKNGGNVVRSINRMVLNNFAGDYGIESEKICFRPWIG